MMDVCKGSIITLDDGNEYIVLRLKEISGVKYAYVQNIADEDDDGFVSIIRDNLKVITDMEQMKYLFANI